ncbi:Aminoacyl-tRNA synthetase class 1a anticodon-binding [Penicillium taxi]|uniref:Aminoacyl-tRNA synthetase class 1a anticodon-binding n=1 Tax=Penicillium taxi TaxID=168475 RepID=UPI00254554A2|nr:Aminoacyl-tRNA synthetase class 1a anticodon-binding [Penicillium taxi]KAJ5902457.1 Aminoacyl-tRNA synthetase class 1a anticodon-binding [Penicillium taxi]
MKRQPITFAQLLVRGRRGQGFNFSRPLSSTSHCPGRLRARLEIPPPFPVIKSCPDPTCDCPTPAMPEGLPIDHEQALNGTMAAYAQQLLICTGQKDWTSRIEDDGEGQGWGNLVRGLKSLLGRGGAYLDPFNNILVTNSSIAPMTTSSSSSASAFLFPSFKYIPSIPTEIASHTDTIDLKTFVRAYLLPKHLHDLHSSLPDDKRAEMTRAPDLASKFSGVIDIEQSPTVLICGHGGRDMRCGVMAPVLEKEFQRVLLSQGFRSASSDNAIIDGPDHANIGRISHVGGHKYAGNVIVYIPPKMTLRYSRVSHPLAGMGIWYGRIEPRHVHDIVQETLFKGNVVADHFLAIMQILSRIRLTPIVAQARLCARPNLRPFALSSNSSNAFTRLSSTAINRKLDLPALDKKWQAKWQSDPASLIPITSEGSDPKPKFFILSMFPYPSGTLHMGHLRIFTISDVLSRFYRMRGYDVLHPMGWDAFGLPAENAAIERGVDPAEWTQQNIAKMKEQLRRISTMFDWDRELATCSPEFYEHTQRIFLMLYEKGLAYQAEALVNYDPVDKTVLANEQVDANGCSWRSGAKVEKLNLKQWFFRITDFKETLLKDLDSLSGGWPERVLSMQRNWLGKSQGAKITFPMIISGQETDEVNINVFTTRPDTLYGVEYLALSLNHPAVLKAAETDSLLRSFLDEASSLPPDSKAGYRLAGVTASHPLQKIDQASPHIQRQLPIFAAPYVLSEYGEGAVMGVPGHDNRDMAFFKENGNPESIPIVIQAEPAKDGESEIDTIVPIEHAKAFTQYGFLTSRCGKYQNLHSKEAAKQIVTDLKNLGQADFVERWRLRDWLISRQRYWGTPIPIIHCADCGPVPVPKEDLPVRLPKIQGDWLKGKKGNPLESSEEWLHTSCPSCGGPAKRDTDTMDTFVDSSWYFLRFLDSANKDAPFSPSVAQPVDFYSGGVEHAILHLLYARFIYKFLAQSDLFPAGTKGPAEPFKTLLSQGMVHGKTFLEPSTGRFLHPDEVDLTDREKPLIKGTEITPNVSFEKMSKSKHNGVDPTVCASKYGADATRAHVLFSAPVSEVLEWDETKIVGVERWFGRLWKLVIDTRQTLAKSSLVASPADIDTAMVQAFPLPPSLDDLSDSDAEAILATHNTILSVTACIESNPYGLNTVISDLIKLTNALSSTPPSSPLALYLSISSLLRLLSPIAPALASESWEILHEPFTKQSSSAISSILVSTWPTPLLTPGQAEVLSSRGGQTVAVQINGKLRCSVTIPRFSTAESTAPAPTREEQEWVIGHVLGTAEGKMWLREKNDWNKRRRVIVVKGGRLVNVVF